eukprot:3059274-Pleurochrysis_carterae.AAC.4
MRGCTRSWAVEAQSARRAPRSAPRVRANDQATRRGGRASALPSDHCPSDLLGESLQSVGFQVA